MQRIGIIVIVFAAAVSVSVTISFLVWGQQRASLSDTRNTELDELLARAAQIEAKLEKLPVSDTPATSPEELEMLRSRVEALEAKVEKFSRPDAAALEQPEDGVEGFLARAEKAAGEKAREVYHQIKEQERRDREEERQRHREERWQRTQEWLTNTYNERLTLLTKELSLTPNQEAEVRETIDVRKESVLKIYANWGRPREERTDNLPSWNDINKTFDTSIKQILDAQQYRTYKEKHLDDFNRSRRGRRGRR